MDEKTHPEMIAATKLPSFMCERHHILVVDDVLSNTKMLVRLLERAGHKCVVATNGQEAIDEYMTNKDAYEAGDTNFQIDTILMDYEMPKLNGPDATKRLRDMGCKVFIFGVTGNVLAEDVSMFKNSGADQVLPKPTRLAAIEAAWFNLETSHHSRKYAL